MWIPGNSVLKRDGVDDTVAGAREYVRHRRTRPAEIDACIDRIGPRMAHAPLEFSGSGTTPTTTRAPADAWADGPSNQTVRRPSASATISRRCPPYSPGAAEYDYCCKVITAG